MVTRSIDTSIREERGLQALLADWNAALALQNPAPTPWTAEQLHRKLSEPLLDSYRTRGIETGGRPIRAALDAALENGNAAQIAAVKTALGLP